ncbi:MAG: gamma carbonic anhydrase family protein [Magnetospiraceae bacterium]
MQPIILPYRGALPVIDPTAFIAPGASLIGNVTIGARSSIWFACVLRGDVERITVGDDTNIQDGTVVHVTGGTFDCRIGSQILIGHSCLIHACELQDGCFIGMHATVMDGVVVESGAMVAAGSLVTPGKVIPAGELWSGSPARKKRDLTDVDRASMADSIKHYVEVAAEYRAGIDP